MDHIESDIAVRKLVHGKTSFEYAFYLGDEYIYIIPLTFGPEFSEDITLIIKGVTENEEVTPAEYKEVKFEESMEGDLTINLTFDQPKDLDLHLLTYNSKQL